MPCPFQHLVITDGTTDTHGTPHEVDLLSPEGFCLLEDGDWRPAITEPKGGGVWKDSQLADGRRPADFKYQNVSEPMTLTVSALDQDALIRDTQELRRLLTKARTYGTTDWQTEPVWIEAQGNGETNMRYAIIWDWRTPNDGNPYEQPFWQTVARAGMDDFTLTLEREPFWRSDEPGSSTCVETAGYGEYCHPCYVEFNATTTIITVPDNGAIRDLHDAAMTVEAWIRADGWGEGNNGRIFDKQSGVSADGWRFYINNTNGLSAQIVCVTTSALSLSGLDDFTVDSDWHHVAMTWDDASYNYPRLWIDGVEVSYDPATTNRNGAIVTDVGNDLYIGNNTTSAFTFDGDIGWTRISNQILYTTTFTPPVRCRLPDDVAGVTVGQWIGAECSGATIDNQEGTAAIDGTLANGSFDCDCLHTYGNVDDDEDVVPTCNEETVYLGNKWNTANITHIFTWSNANGFSGNLVGSGFPITLVDIVGLAPAVNDYVVFGVAGTADAGPFANLVFDIETAISGITIDDWEYSTGAPGWADLAAEQDNTNQDGVMGGSSFDTTGIKSIHWEQPTGWAAQAENGITGYWVRGLITAAPGPHVAPTQVNREVYTITWPFVDILAEDIGGDVPALIQLLLRGQSNRNYSTGALPDLWSTRMLVGLRSYDRSPDFTAYINLADRQNTTGITIYDTGGAPSFFTNDGSTPTGRKIRCPNIAAAWTVLGIVNFASTIVDDFAGKFRLFLRVDQYGGAANTISLYCGIRFGTSDFQRWTPTVYVSSTSAWFLMDFGQVTFPPISNILPSEYGEITVYIYGYGDGASDLDLFDLILLPIDEWCIDTVEPYPGVIPPNVAIGGRGATAKSSYLDLDGLTVTKRRVRTLLKRFDNGHIISNYFPVTAGAPIAQANSHQRFWFLQDDVSTTSHIGSQPEVVVSATANKVQRYYSMRGDR